MGQKSHPRGLRLGIIEGLDSKCYASHNYTALLQEDFKLRDFIKRRLHTARPGIVIGKKGAEIDKLKGDIQKLMKGKEAFINIHEVRRPDLDPQLVAENIALQLERRVAFRRAMKEAVLRAMRMGAQGVKVHVAGRLGGAEIARVEWYREGRVPLQTLRADVAYGFAEARTTYGQIGVKVWIFRGEVLTRKEEDIRRSGLSGAHQQ
jgi:small subunit ribosomal protein S3